MVRIELTAVWLERAVVVGVLIAVPVEIAVVERIAGITQTVGVRIGLTGIGVKWAVVSRVRGASVPQGCEAFTK